VEVIPSIDIREGRCVRLLRGDFSRETVYGTDPSAMAQRWHEEGASRLHVVDLDGSAAGLPVQRELILKVLSQFSGTDMRVQVAGGIRRAADVAAYLETGADRVVLGSAAIKDQETVLNACARYPGRVVVAIDARDGKVATEGWYETSEVDAIDLALELEAAGVPRFLYTDINRDGTLQGPNCGSLRKLIESIHVPVIASGGVGALEDISNVAATGAEAVILGRALYEEVFSLREARESSTI
jgi:phosphoribosylformimino-5-aminoimidazole carboxamide ribotide isomerase